METPRTALGVLLIESCLKRPDADMVTGQNECLCRLSQDVSIQRVCRIQSAFILKRSAAFSRTPVTMTYCEVNSFGNKCEETALPGP